MAAAADLPVGPENAVPLAASTPAPGGVVKTVDGADFDLGSAFSKKPTVLIFYRGGWCPFCNRQLASMQDYAPKFLALGYQILAVCSDKPESLKATMDKDHLTYTILSDRTGAASQAYKVAYRLADADAAKYASHHIALAPIPGDPSGVWLPVPSVFIVGTDGVIKFVSFNPDFKVRPPAETIFAAAKSALN